MLPYIITRDLADEHIQQMRRQATVRGRSYDRPAWSSRAAWFSGSAWSGTGRRLAVLLHLGHAATSAAVTSAASGVQGATSPAAASTCNGQPMGCVA